MSKVVFSIGSNIGDRLAHLQSVLDGLGQQVRAVSGVYETAAWGGVEQDAFLNAVVIADDPACDCRAWLRRGQKLEAAADRVRSQRWGPRTLDVDVVTCHDEAGQVLSLDPELTLPHPRAHERAFVLVPWLDVEPQAMLTVGRTSRPVAALLASVDDGEREGVRITGLALHPAGWAD